MVEAVSHNTILASAFGSAPARRVLGNSPIVGDQSDPALQPAPTDAYPQPVDTVEISTAAFGNQSASPETNRPDQVAKTTGPAELSDKEQANVRKLKTRDQEVRRHEQAHKASAGQYASGGPSFEYTTGPDGKRYAVGGEVNIDTSEVSGDPQATIAKMQQIQRAASAPANPSSQDRAVAARAAAAERTARAELTEQRSAPTSGEAEPSTSAQRTGKSDASPSPRQPTGGSTDPAGVFLDLIA